MLVGVLGGGYLHALELVPWWLVLGRFVVGVPLVNVPWSLCPAGWCAWWWLPACLEPRVLLVGVLGWCVLVGVPLVNVPCSLCLGGSCWLEVVTWIP